MQGDKDTDNAWINRSQLSLTTGALKMSANPNKLAPAGADPGFQTRGFDLGPPKAFPCRGVRGKF